jgi:hypothetical protein
MLQNPKVVVFDLDETLGHFSQFGLFWDILKDFINKDFTQDDFNQLLDLYPEFIRPNITSLFTFLKYKKDKKKCNGIMIYTNNQGPREWVIMIKNYFHDKLRYDLFDQVIAAFKVNGKVVELGRTSHDKSVEDFIYCTKVPQHTQICFLDDMYHPKMIGDNVYYINLKPYVYHLTFDEILEKFLKSDYSDRLFENEKDKNRFVQWFHDKAKNSSFNYIEKSKEEYEIDKIVTKKTMIMLQDFFNKNTGSEKTRKNFIYKKKKQTLKNL